MIVECPDCHRDFGDSHRSTICPHETFAANDGENNFAHHPETFLSDPANTKRQYPILVVCALIVQEGCVLLERHAPNGTDSTVYLWDIPGGKVEIGETPEHAVVREIREEMGVEIEAIKLLPRLGIPVWGDRHWVLATYECCILSGEPMLSNDLQWHPIHSLDQSEVKTPDFKIIKGFYGH